MVQSSRSSSMEPSRLLEPVAYSIANDDSPLAIGTEVRASGPGNFKGKIDEVMVYNRALSVQEINSLYNAEAFSYSDDVWNYLTITGPDLVKPGDVGSYTVSGMLTAAIHMAV